MSLPQQMSHNASTIQSNPINHINDHAFIYNPGREDKSYFSNYYLMLFTTMIYFLCGVISAVDSYCALFYINNPQIYAFNLAYEYGFWLTPYYSSQYDTSLLSSPLYSNIKGFKQLLKENTTITEEMIYNYSIVHKELSGDISRRYFVYHFLFSCTLVASSLCGYTIRRPSFKWRQDMFFCFLSESLSSLAFLGGIIIWLLIEFMNDYNYFIYLRIQIVFHYMSIIFFIIGLGLKIYWMIILYSCDYFGNVKSLYNKHK